MCFVYASAPDAAVACFPSVVATASALAPLGADAWGGFSSMTSTLVSFPGTEFSG